MTARIRRAARREEGAAAVEFALLLPIFVMLVFGVISTGIAFWHHISDVQAARDAARYGATLPVAPSGTDTTCDKPNIPVSVWLGCVIDVAAREAGWTGGASTVGTTGDNGYICVAWVKDTTAGSSATVPTTKLTAGTANPDDPTSPAIGPATGGCFDDGTRSDGRVQVYIRRDATFNAVLFTRTWNMNTQISVPYERGTP